MPGPFYKGEIAAKILESMKRMAADEWRGPADYSRNLSSDFHTYRDWIVYELPPKCGDGALNVNIMETFPLGQRIGALARRMRCTR